MHRCGVRKAIQLGALLALTAIALSLFLDVEDLVTLSRTQKEIRLPQQREATLTEVCLRTPHWPQRTDAKHGGWATAFQASS